MWLRRHSRSEPFSRCRRLATRHPTRVASNAGPRGASLSGAPARRGTARGDSGGIAAAFVQVSLSSLTFCEMPKLPGPPTLHTRRFMRRPQCHRAAMHRAHDRGVKRQRTPEPADLCVSRHAARKCDRGTGTCVNEGGQACDRRAWKGHSRWMRAIRTNGLSGEQSDESTQIPPNIMAI